MEKFGEQGAFLRSAFFAFFNQDLIDFLNRKGLQTKIERQGRVFPSTHRARSIIKVFNEYLLDNKVQLLLGVRLLNIKRQVGFLQLDLDGRDKINAKKVILATGGVSYKITGSTGDGYRIAKKLGHTIIPLSPALIPLRTKESWVRQLQGLTLKNIRIRFEYGKNKKKIISEVGELMFTHFGVSGPLVLDLSANIVSKLNEDKEARLFVDLKPGLRSEQLEKRLLNEFKAQGKGQLKNMMKSLLPRRLIPIFVSMLGLDLERRVNQITQKQRRAIISLLKALPLVIVGSLPIEEAMVTDGGISTREINPRTMESRIVPGLFFAGEIIDGCAPSGGYNLQQAIATGYLAGEEASYA